MEEMEQLKVQVEQHSDLVNGAPLVVVELVKKLEKRVRDVEKLSDVAALNQLVTAKLYDKLEKRVLDVEKRLERRATNLEQWSEDTAEAINEVKDRVTTLERYCW